eukprot:181167-Rhodomonas_salina.1
MLWARLDWPFAARARRRRAIEVSFVLRGLPRERDGRPLQEWFEGIGRCRIQMTHTCEAGPDSDWKTADRASDSRSKDERGAGKQGKQAAEGRAVPVTKQGNASQQAPQALRPGPSVAAQHSQRSSRSASAVLGMQLREARVVEEQYQTMRRRSLSAHGASLGR